MTLTFGVLRAKNTRAVICVCDVGRSRNKMYSFFPLTGEEHKTKHIVKNKLGGKKKASCGVAECRGTNANQKPKPRQSCTAMDPCGFCTVELKSGTGR